MHALCSKLRTTFICGCPLRHANSRKVGERGSQAPLISHVNMTYGVGGHGPSSTIVLGLVGVSFGGSIVVGIPSRGSSAFGASFMWTPSGQMIQPIH
jgi:hypothetical protein